MLEVSLRKAGFTVTSAQSVQDALDKLELGTPDLIISETAFPDGDGFELRRRVRGSPDWAEIPFVFLTAEVAIENKIRGLELGVDDYLTKPIYIKEIITRINILLQKRQRARFEERRDGRMRFAGRVADMPVVDVIQTIEISRKSGVIQFTADHHRQGAIYFREGKVIDAEAGALQGEDAVYRLLTWSDGDFEVVFRTVRRRDAITTSSQGLLMEGMRRLDEWSRLLEQLPPLDHRFEIDTAELSVRLGEVPDDNNEILRLLDGRRTLIEVIDSAHFGDLECLQAISRLYFEGLLIDLDHGVSKRADSGKPVPLDLVEDDPVVADHAPPIDSSPVAAPPVRPSELSRLDAVVAAVEHGPELSAGFRTSSLRLIEQAVAAAEAVEPVLYDGPDAPGVIEMAQRVAREAAERASETEDAHAVPHEIEADEPDTGRGISTSGDFVVSFKNGATVPLDASDAPEPLSVEIAVDEPYRPGREDSGLRMIGSLGHDRAEASGELIPVQAGEAPERPPAQREMVTILPRRITREIPAVPAPDAAASPDANPSAGPTSPTVVERPIPTSPATAPAAELPPRARTPSAPPTGTHRSTKPNTGAIGLLVLAAILTALALYTRFHRDHGGTPERTPIDAAVMSPPAPLDAALPPPSSAHAGATTPAEVPPADAGVGSPIDAAASAAAPPPPLAPAAVNAQAAAVLDQARVALDGGHAQQALDLVTQSLRLHRTSKGQILKAQALQKLDRTDDAAAALAIAIQITPTADTYGVAAGLYWSMSRFDIAKAAMLRYLDLEPTGPHAAEFKRRVDEPR
nr:DUF4388 domain-containing protein [Kofleriaceae bacterium]